MSTSSPIPSYWQSVGKEFRRSRLARVALWITSLTFLVAGLAPLLCNRAPLLYRHGGCLDWPVFAELQPLDWFWLGLVLWSLLCLGLWCWRRPRVLVVWAFVVGMILLATWVRSQPVRLHSFNWSMLYQQALPEGDWLLRTPLHHGPLQTDPMAFRAAPSWQHPFGTDEVGRDVLARLIYGSRVALAIGFSAMFIALVLGVLVGSIAGYFSGWPDLVLSRLIEIMISFPKLFLILIVLAFFPRSLLALAVLIGLLSWIEVARLLRGEFLRLKGQEFVLAARALGAGAGTIILRHLLPNSLAPVLVAATFGVARAILLEATLSFLNLGVPPPTPTWGEVLAQGKHALTYAPWLTLFPGLVLFLTLTSFNFVGEGLRDAMDPRDRRSF
jgi:peptide/nickel transport system permease protein